MRHITINKIMRVDSISDLKYGEYMCTECNKVIDKAENVIKNDSSDSLTKNGINFCSEYCRKSSRSGYDKVFTSIFKNYGV